MIDKNYIYIGIFLQVIGSYSYLIETLRGKVKPNRVTWFLWSLAPLVAFAAQVSQGVGVESLATFIVGFVPLVIFIASFVNKSSEWKVGKLDIFCGSLSLLGLLLWFLTRVGNVALFFSIMADGLAALPTIIKSLKEPETESSTIFLFGIFNSLVALLIIDTWKFENYGFVTYLLVVNAILYFSIKFKLGKYILKKSN